jgi:glutaredoxin
MDAMQDLLDTYEKSHETTGKNKLTKEEILARYFNPRKSVEKFRILPPLAGRKVVETAYFHEMRVKDGDGTYTNRKFYCLSKNNLVPKTDENGEVIRDQNGQPVMVNPPCPLCEKAKRYLEAQDPTTKGKKREEIEADPNLAAIDKKNKALYTASKKWEAKEFYIVRGIDRNAQGDGVKHWRFKFNFKRDGVLDKLVPAVQNWTESTGVAFYDADKGIDLTINSAKATIPNTNIEYTKVSAINTAPQASPLSDDPVMKRKWLEDDTTWRDVYKTPNAPNVSAYEIYEMICESPDQNKVETYPYWSEKTKKWVFPNRPDLEEQANNRQQNTDHAVSDSSHMASDLLDQLNTPTSMDNLTPSDAGTYNDTTVDPTNVQVDEPEVKTKPVETVSTSEQPQQDSGIDLGSIDDLPF